MLKLYRNGRVAHVDLHQKDIMIAAGWGIEEQPVEAAAPEKEKPVEGENPVATKPKAKPRVKPRTRINK